MRLAAPLLVLLAAVAPAAAQQYAVADLRVVGSQRYTAQEISRATGIEKGKKDVPLAQVKAAAEKLLASGAFQEVSYRHTAMPGGMRVEFTLKDNEHWVRADFDNIVWLSPAELQQELNARLPLFKGELPINISGSLPEDVAAALQGLLNERGVKATVGFGTSGPREGLTDAFVFTVDDVAVTIGQLNFAGTSPQFSGLLEAAARPLLGTHFQRSSLKKFVESNILSVYRKRGHLRVEFGTPEISVVTNTGTATTVAVTLPVQEGRAYTFAGLKWTGNTVRSSDQLDGYLHLRPGQVADGVQLDTDVLGIRTRYAALGYMHMLLDLKPMYDEAAGTVRYEAAITEGALFKMGKLEITGLQPASAERVRQRWRMREGDPFDANYVRTFFNQFRLPRDVVWNVEQSEGEAPQTVDLTLIFCKAGTRCLPSAPHQLYIPEEEERRR